MQDNGIDFTENEPLKHHTSFEIGGPARLFCRPKDAPQFAIALRLAKAAGLPVMVLGKGTNVLFCDAGFSGMVLCTAPALDALSIEDNCITAGAGAPLKEVCLAAGQAGLAGLEFAYGIPGSVGGAVYMNAGAFEGDMSSVLQSATLLDAEGNTVTLPVKALGLGYRTSVLQQNGATLLEATFELQPGDVATIEANMQRYMEHRQRAQPLDVPSAGSAFKRPPGAFAGELIDRCGLRGFQLGGAAISQKHCGFIVNLGGATCADVLALADHVVRTVKAGTGFDLEKEIRVIAEDGR